MICTLSSQWSCAVFVLRFCFIVYVYIRSFSAPLVFSARSRMLCESYALWIMTTSHMQWLCLFYGSLIGYLWCSGGYGCTAVRTCDVWNILCQQTLVVSPLDDLCLRETSVNQPDLNWTHKARPRHSFAVCSQHCFSPKTSIRYIYLYSRTPCNQSSITVHQ